LSAADFAIMLTQRLLGVGSVFRRAFSEGARKLQILRDRLQEILGEDGPEERGLTLLREWLSPEQRAQLDANKRFDVIGCQTGKRYRISYGSGTNVHEIDDTGRPIMGWCFVPSGYLVPGDVMLAQKIALETDELTALAVANRFPARVQHIGVNGFRRRAY
jgi:hypothetical protein